MISEFGILLGMKTVYIIHGCPTDEEKAMDPELRTYDKHWIPWTKKELMVRGFKVETPTMPEPWDPRYEAFKKEFEKYSVSEEDILIGHSCGTTFLTRWLGDSKQKVAKLILVAPWCIAWENTEANREFSEQPVDESIKDRVGELIMFTSDNEHEDGKKVFLYFMKNLVARLLNSKVVDIT